MFMSVKKAIFVGLSGGVDSSVAALRLKNAGHTVVGVFIKVWQPDFLVCDWEKERLDAMRVAAHLDIPFLTFDAEEAYKTHVADYMIEEYRKGRTPNPDVMCNEHVKFGVFLDFALAHGADAVATGHYARVDHTSAEHTLLRGKDPEKDQSYFLWRLTLAQRSRVLFPIGDTRKEDIRKEAARAGIPTAAKRDSQGICFLGHVDMEEFLSHYITTEKGDVLDEAGNSIGTHNGALFYTLGQRHGFTIHTKGGDQHSLYVIAKDMDANTITVRATPRTLDTEHISLTECNIAGDWNSKTLTAQFRYRQKPFQVSVDMRESDCAMLTVLETNIDVPSAGQSCVIYDGDTCLGGGIIA